MSFNETKYIFTKLSNIIFESGLIPNAWSIALDKSDMGNMCLFKKLQAFLQYFIKCTFIMLDFDPTYFKTHLGYS